MNKYYLRVFSALGLVAALGWGACSDAGSGGAGSSDNNANNDEADGGVGDNNDPDRDDDAGDRSDADLEGDAAPPPSFDQSCIFAVLSCFGQAGEALSCTVNALNGQAAVSYDQGRAVIQQADPQGRLILDTYAEDNVCYSAKGVTPGPTPAAWNITQPGFEATPFGVEIAGDEAVVTCVDGSVERYPAADVRPLLPTALAVDDPSCLSLDDAQCSVDIDCEGAQGGPECCKVIDIGRCLDQAICPRIPEGLTGCMKETMDCFGAGRSPLDCQISRATGEVRINYSANRSAVFREDEARNLTIEASNNLGTCFVARSDGSNPFVRLDLTDANTGRLVPILFQGGRAFITCDEETTERHPEDFVLRNLPVLLGSDDDLCELVD